MSKINDAMIKVREVLAVNDTPRTECYVLNPLPQVVSAEFARELERELNAAQDRINELEEVNEFLRSKIHKTDNGRTSK